MFIQLLPNEVSSKPMRNILGMNNIPRTINRDALKRDVPRFEALQLKHVRFHDAPLENPSQRLVDISAIFPLFHLDETKEENYFFAQTDDYLRTLEHSSAEIDFRLGETIDHSDFFRLVRVPKDIDKWARICRRIVGHYKNGEMNGMHLNIKRISVWEEPDNSELLNGGTIEKYAEMFCKVYRVIKNDFPDIMVGGPASIASRYTFLDRFLTLCEAQGITPDFVSGTYYVRSLELLRDRLDANLAVMQKHGMTDTKYVLTEWHYGPRDWSRVSYLKEHGFLEPDSAAFAVAALIELMDIDEVHAAYYYSWATNSWGLHNNFEGSNPLLPVYYGLFFFQQLAAQCEERIAVAINSAKDTTRVLAGKTLDKKTLLLIACHNCSFVNIQVDCMGKTQAKLKRITGDYREELCTVGENILPKDDIFVIEHTGGSGVYLLEFDL